MTEFVTILSPRRRFGTEKKEESKAWEQMSTLLILRRQALGEAAVGANGAQEAWVKRGGEHVPILSAS